MYSLNSAFSKNNIRISGHKTCNFREDETFILRSIFLTNKFQEL